MHRIAVPLLLLPTRTGTQPVAAAAAAIEETTNISSERGRRVVGVSMRGGMDEREGGCKEPAAARDETTSPTLNGAP